MKTGLRKYIENNWAVFWVDERNHLSRQGKRLSNKYSWEHQIAARIYVLTDLTKAVKFVKNELGLSLREALEVCKAWKGEDKRL